MSHWTPLEWKTETDAKSGMRVHRLKGVLTDSPNSYAFLHGALEELKRDPRPMLLEMSGVEHLTSAGVGVLAALYTSTTNAKIPMALAALSRRGQLIIEVVNLHRLLAVYAGEGEAGAALAGAGWKPGA